MSPAQTSRYWRTWGAICAEHGWKNSDSARRHAMHKAWGLPESTKRWNTTTHFDRFLHETAALLNHVDIRDRAREREEFAIKNLTEAITLLTGSDAYARRLISNIHDTSDSQDIALDPISDQYQDGRVDHFVTLRNGAPKAVYKADLQNHKRHLKNRLNDLLTRMKKGEMDAPKGKEWWCQFPNRHVVAAVAGGQRLYAMPAPVARRFVPAASKDELIPF